MSKQPQTNWREREIDETKKTNQMIYVMVLLDTICRINEWRSKWEAQKNLSICVHSLKTANLFCFAPKNHSKNEVDLRRFSFEMKRNTSKWFHLEMPIYYVCVCEQNCKVVRMLFVIILNYYTLPKTIYSSNGERGRVRQF